MRQSPLCLAVVLIVSMLPMKAVHADDQDVIDYREHVMKTMGEQAGAIAQILEKKVPADNFAMHLQVLAVTAATAKKAFEAKVIGGEAKADVWMHWADFAKRLDDLSAATASLAATALSGGLAAAAPKVEGALTCKSCHDVYRENKK
jgi:cytochrome c556